MSGEKREEERDLERDVSLEKQRHKIEVVLQHGVTNASSQEDPLMKDHFL